MICEEVLERLIGCSSGVLLPDRQMCEDAAEVIGTLLDMAEVLRERAAVPEDLYRAALTTWGADAQTTMVFEEMSELQNALCKLERGRGTVDQVAEEIADVQIILEQMTVLHDCAGAVARARDHKLQRLGERVEEVGRKCASAECPYQDGQNEEGCPATELCPGFEEE